MNIRQAQTADRPAMLAIINHAADAYRGTIPADCWHEPYMPAAELDAEIGRGVAFTGLALDGTLVGVMGLQPVRNVTLIRQASFLPDRQGQGIRTALMRLLSEGWDG